MYTKTFIEIFLIVQMLLLLQGVIPLVVGIKYIIRKHTKKNNILFCNIPSNSNSISETSKHFLYIGFKKHNKKSSFMFIL